MIDFLTDHLWLTILIILLVIFFSFGLHHYLYYLKKLRKRFENLVAIRSAKFYASIILVLTKKVRLIFITSSKTTTFAAVALAAHH